MAGSWIDIQSDALAHNVRVVRSVIGPSVRLMAVVKSNAYGHGMVDCAMVFRDAGVDAFGVDAIDEGVTLRAAGITDPIVVLNPVDLREITTLLHYQLQPMISGVSWLSSCRQLGLRVHLKVDTGMGRQGVLPNEVPGALQSIRQHPGVHLVGVATHFACADDPARVENRQQWEQWQAICRDEALGGVVLHAANSAATLAFPETHHDMVRVGLALYGMNPFFDTDTMAHDPDLASVVTIVESLRPALSWKTRLVQIKEAPAGWCVGYGCTERLADPRRIGLLPVGYGDGYDRRLSSQGFVVVRDQEVPVVGRVSMNLVAVDVTDVVEARVGDVVTLLGGGCTAERMAHEIGTINYEITTRIAEHIPRYVLPASRV